jgi:anti-anti-sigma factor
MSVSEAGSEHVLRLHSLELATRRNGDDQVIALGGELDIACAAPVEAEIMRAEEGDCRQIVLDLRQLAFLDSSGIHMLAKAYARQDLHGRKLVVLLPPPGGVVHRVLEVSGILDRIAA